MDIAAPFFVGFPRNFHKTTTTLAPMANKNTDVVSQFGLINTTGISLIEHFGINIFSILLVLFVVVLFHVCCAKMLPRFCEGRMHSALRRHDSSAHAVNAALPI